MKLYILQWFQNTKNAIVIFYVFLFFFCNVETWYVPFFFYWFFIIYVSYGKNLRAATVYGLNFNDYDRSNSTMLYEFHKIIYLILKTWEQLSKNVSKTSLKMLIK